MDDTASFGYWLRRRRKARDLTQADLARAVGCALGTIRKLESDERRPSRAMALRLAQVLAIPAADHSAFLQAARAERSMDQLVISTQPLMQQGTAHLPIPPTPLIGRIDEIGAVWQVLSGEDVRLLTLVGPPGIGKTRLGLQVAAELRDQFPDGVYFIALAPITDPALVAPTIAHAVGVMETEGRGWIERLHQTLREKAVLLVLDNFEQVVDAAPLVSELLQGAPRLKVLATSRVPLHLYGEHEFAVPPLTLPDVGHVPPVDELLQYEAIRLFNARAQAAKANFVITADNAPAITAICAQVDGLPLAIELAATRIKFFSPHLLLERLRAHDHAALQLLQGGARDLPPRHQTLRHAIAWSYDLLNAHERQVFKRLGVFVGGWTTTAAAALCGAEGNGIRDVAAILESLYDQSLLVHSWAADGEARWAMLETIREYALDQLGASGAEAQVRHQHAAYFLVLAETAAPHLRGPDQVVWLDRLEADHDNFRAALRWSLDQGETEMALRLAIALMRFWLAHAHLSEGRRWLERALTSSNGLPIALRAKALFEAGGLADQQGDHEQQRALQEASLLMYQQLNDPLGIAAVLNCLGNIEPDGARARALHEESLWLYREQGDTVGVAKVLINLSCDVASQGNYEQAQTLLEESLALSRQISDSTGIGYALINMGCNALQQGHHVQAVAHLRKSLESFYQLRDRRLIAECLEELANATAHEHPRRAAQLWGAAATLRDAIGVIMPARDPATNELYQATARGAIGDGAFDAAWAEGQAMLLEQVVVVALEEQREMSSPQRAKAVQV